MATAGTQMARLLTLGFLASPLLGCADGYDDLHEEPSPGEEELAIGKADGGSAALWTYYAVVREDTRGGLWVKRLNQPDTKCADNKWKDECYVDVIDWSRAGFSEGEATQADRSARALQSILRGKMVLEDVEGRASRVFRATESWESDEDGVAEGTALWARAQAACASGTCEDIPGTRLNKGGAAITATYATLGGAGLGAALPALAGEDGVILVGAIGKAGNKKTFEALQAWQRRGHTEAESERTDGPACSASALGSFPKDELRVHVIDVGQGDAIWVQTPWKSARSESLNVLVDAGASGDMPGASPGGEVVVSYLLEAGLEEGDILDALVVTHAHDDHFGGVERVAQSFGIARYTDPGFSAGSAAFLAARKAAREHVEEHDGHMHVPAVSELVPRVFSDSDLFGPRVETTLLWAADKPPSGRTTNPTGPDVNNTSIALALEYGGRKVLLMGDVEEAVEAALVAAHDAGEVDLEASILKVAHHGSSRTTGSEFLARVFPEKRSDRWAVISSGRRTFTGSYLPTETTIERLHAALPEKHLLSTENRDQHKVVGDEHGDDHVLVRVKASGQVSVCYLP